jgi:hypothetical protein
MTRTATCAGAFPPRSTASPQLAKANREPASRAIPELGGARTAGPALDSRYRTHMPPACRQDGRAGGAGTAGQAGW